MKSVARSARMVVLAFSCLTGSCTWACAQGNIDSFNKYAWAENAGWMNFAPTHGGVTVAWNAPRYLCGYAWAENIGWIKLGHDGGGPYQNTATNNWGVNIGSGGVLSGYAWSANCGWVHFSATSNPVIINRNDGRFGGYAWAENVGWLHFAGSAPAYGVQTTARPSDGTAWLLY